MTDIATSLISDDEREYLILQKRANAAADDGTYEWALNEIERLREALRDIYDLEPDIHYPDWYQRAACSIARAALGEGKE